MLQAEDLVVSPAPSWRMSWLLATILSRPRQAWRRNAAVACLAIVLVQLVAAPPGRADVLDCLKLAAVPFTEAAKGLNLAACADDADPNALSAALVGVAAGMAAGWLPDDGEACVSAKWKVAAKLMAMMLDLVPVPLPPGVSKDDIKNQLNNAGYEAYQQILANNPVLQKLDSLFECACRIDAFAKNEFDYVLNEAKKCAGFIGDVINTLGDAFEGWGEGFAQMPGAVACTFSLGTIGCSSGGTAPPCWGINCAAGNQCYAYNANSNDITKAGYNPDPAKACAPCSLIQYATSSSKAGLCACPPTFLADYVPWYGQQLLKGCICPPHLSAVWNSANNGVQWKCGCEDGQVLMPSGQCQLICGVNQKGAKATVSLTVAGSDGLFGALGAKLYTKTKWYCEKCDEGTMSDGSGPCVPCAGERSFVSNGTCQTCKQWQTAVRVPAAFGVSHCEDICVNGVYLPAVNPSAAPTGTVQEIPGLGGKKDQSTSVMQIAPKQAKQQTPLPPGGGSAGPTGTPMLAKQDCKPCEENSYALNNQCHSCGKTGLADLAARVCTPCAEGKVANAISGVWMCTADCSRVKRGVGNARLVSSNFIVDPKDIGKCIPCDKGSQPNAAHTHCVTTLSLPHGPGTVKLTPELPSGGPEKRKTGGKGTVGKVLSCPPRMHPNPSGTGCLPDIDMPGTLTPGSGPHPGSPATGRAGGR